VNTEITDTKNENGCVCFDADCRLCVNLARRFGSLLQRHRFALVPLQTPWVKNRLARSGEELLSEIRLFASEGQIYGGADALIEIARRIWWAKPIHWLAQVPALRLALRTGYRWVARKRTCFRGTCSVVADLKRPTVGVVGWILALVPTGLAIGLGTRLPAWVWMWAIALALFFGAKWITILRFLRSGHRADFRRLLAYALLWPGMDMRAFCAESPRPATAQWDHESHRRSGFLPLLLWRRGPGRGGRFSHTRRKVHAKEPVPLSLAREWAFAAAKTLFGAEVVWFGVPLMGATRPFLTGWVGMIGIVLMLHFGLFYLLSLSWRTLGINARPIMQSPVAATSLGRFWSGSWNTAFTDLMHENLFKPLSRAIGPRRAILSVFLVSGLLHELVISLPARGGYGLPTAYFLLQGLGLLFERSQLGRRPGIGSRVRGWCYVALVAGVPAFWLFHPVFIHHVILPMLHAIGAT
jgi:predicted DCC family thiol-disulfide oxidoreductase YuxK